MLDSRLPVVRLLPLTPAALSALAECNFAAADAAFGRELARITKNETWLWRLRRDQIVLTPGDRNWVAYVIVNEVGTAVGHAGFHGGPDPSGMAEVGYSVDPAYRGRGFAKAALAELIARARREPDVRTLRATVRPDNAASLAVIRGAGLVENDDQRDARDGRELIFEMPV
ncbi:GNAT family N-acetyltransferase [Solicola gregarius]|uniref:GNAT family N-acetyltransferase n=1 Tax=Solicola gregarius TaxID=2908642 RepID=A0AA46YM20_9ACTN|nr:GNAT family N-acetyltransferase [Solicola gregarius]UYM05383.1 GNAT family N-acetyltransferase [Solicola gregarius]